MAQKVKDIKLQIPAGKATPAPPVGTVLGPAGINLQEFCTKFNDATRDKMGDIVPVEISLYEDRTFDFVLKTAPAPFLIKKAAKIQKASAKGANETVATITLDDLRAIAETKLPDLNAYDVEAAMKIIEGTARNMGIATIIISISITINSFLSLMIMTILSVHRMVWKIQVLTILLIGVVLKAIVC